MPGKKRHRLSPPISVPFPGTPSTMSERDAAHRDGESTPSKRMRKGVGLDVPPAPPTSSCSAHEPIILRMVWSDDRWWCSNDSSPVMEPRLPPPCPERRLPDTERVELLGAEAADAARPDGDYMSRRRSPNPLFTATAVDEDGTTTGLDADDAPTSRQS